MKKYISDKFMLIVALLAVLVLGLNMLYSLNKLDQFAKDSSLHKLEASTASASYVVKHTLDQYEVELEGLAVNLMTIDDSLLPFRLSNFVHVTHYNGVTLFKQDGTMLHQGEVPDRHVKLLNFPAEANRGNYIGTALWPGSLRAKQYVCQAVPVKQNGQVVAMLYGYLDLETLASLITNIEKDTGIKFFLVDAESGEILVDELHRTATDGEELPLNNVYGEQKYPHAPLTGYSWEEVEQYLRQHKTGYIAFSPRGSDEVIYQYHLPMPINRWMMIANINEKVAFADYEEINKTIMISYGLTLMVIIGLMILGVWATNNIRKREVLKQISTHDYLTGVGNRYAMYEFTSELEQGQSVGVIYCDVTGLKRVNDELGHEAGDKLLQLMISDVLTEFKRDNVFRLGGDEFVIIVSGMTEQKTQKHLAELKARWSRDKIVVAVGYDWIDSYSGNHDTLLEKAEKRMYEAKTTWYQENGVERRRT